MQNYKRMLSSIIPKLIKKTGKQMVDNITKIADTCSEYSGYLCCNKESFKKMEGNVTSIIKMMENNSTIKSKLESFGLKLDKLNFIKYIFNTEQVEKDYAKYKYSFFIFKLVDDNFKGAAATFIRYLLCNILNISKFTNDLFTCVGNATDITDTIKCGFVAGRPTSFFYYFAVIFIPVSLIPVPVWVHALISILILALCYFLKSKIPVFPIPLSI